MKRYVVATLLVAVLGAQSAHAQALPEGKPPYSIWTTPTLLRFPGSPFDALRTKGIDIGGSVTSFYQSLTSGSGDHSWRHGAKGDLKVAESAVQSTTAGDDPSRRDFIHIAALAAASMTAG
jgi:hypothetical protein